MPMCLYALYAYKIIFILQLSPTGRYVMGVMAEDNEMHLNSC